MGSRLKEIVISCNIYFATLLLCVSLVLGGVEIVKPYHPLYVKAGNSLTISCESADRTDLKWLQQTSLTSWTDMPIEPLIGSNVVIQLFREEPSGFTRSTLIKHNMSLADRGTYICKDDTSNYGVWVTVLYINAQNLSDISPELDPVVLSCSISGFDSNIPTIDYDWKFGEMFIPHPHYEVAATVNHSPSRLSSIDRYKVTMNGNILRLEIHNPSTLDGGLYTCTFTLSTNLGAVTFSESLFVNGSLLMSRNTATEQSVLHLYHLPFMTVIIVLLFSFCT